MQGCLAECWWRAGSFEDQTADQERSGCQVKKEILFTEKSSEC